MGNTGLGSVLLYGLIGLIVVAFVAFIIIALTVQRTKGLTSGDDER